MSRQCNAIQSHWIRQAHAEYYAHASNTDTLRPGTNDTKIFQILFASFVPTLRFFIEKQRKALRVQIFLRRLHRARKREKIKRKKETFDIRCTNSEMRYAGNIVVSARCSRFEILMPLSSSRESECLRAPPPRTTKTPNKRIKMF